MGWGLPEQKARGKRQLLVSCVRLESNHRGGRGKSDSGARALGSAFKVILRYYKICVPEPVSVNRFLYQSRAFGDCSPRTNPSITTREFSRDADLRLLQARPKPLFHQLHLKQSDCRQSMRSDGLNQYIEHHKAVMDRS